MYENYLSHKGTKGSKWGYNKGKRNGKRTAKVKVFKENGITYTKIGSNSDYGTYKGDNGGTYKLKKGKTFTTTSKTQTGDSYEYEDNKVDRLFGKKPKKIKTMSMNSKEYARYATKGLTAVNKILGKSTKKVTKTFKKKKK